MIVIPPTALISGRERDRLWPLRLLAMPPNFCLFPLLFPREIYRLARGTPPKRPKAVCRRGGVGL